MKKPVVGEKGSVLEYKVIRKRHRDVLDFSGTEVSGVDSNDDMSGSHISPGLIDSSSFPADGDNDQLTDTVSPSARTTHRIVTPVSLKDFSTNSRTVCVSPVANTKSSGFSCCIINHIPSNKQDRKYCFPRLRTLNGCD